jgi:hypothetical protein
MAQLNSTVLWRFAQYGQEDAPHLAHFSHLTHSSTSPTNTANPFKMAAHKNMKARLTIGTVVANKLD